MIMQSEEYKENQDEREANAPVENLKNEEMETQIPSAEEESVASEVQEANEDSQLHQPETNADAEEPLEAADADSTEEVSETIEPSKKPEINEQPEAGELPEASELPEAEEMPEAEEIAKNESTAGAEEISVKGNETDEEDSEPTDSEEESNEIELPDLNELNTAELIQLAKKLIQDHGLVELKKPMDLVRQRFHAALKEEWNAKQEAFIEEGGEAADFIFDQPEKNTFHELYGFYRDKLSAHQAELERTLKANLKRREQIIQEIDQLTFSEEPDEVAHARFRELQAEWKEIGPVPKGASSALYRSYHFHLEKYFDNKIKLNWAFRDLEFQRNLELKQELVAKAEALLAEKSIKKAMDELQILHRIWKEDTGPVAPDQREVVWDAFSAATKALHDRRQAHLDELKEKWDANAEVKRGILNALNEEAQATHESHQQWQKALERVAELNEKFRKAGPVSRAENDALWTDMRAANSEFNKAKNEFYRGLKESYQVHIDARNRLIAKAEELANSDQWKDTAIAIKKLQEEWKTIGAVPASVNNSTWKAFQKACNSFFKRRKAHFAERDAEQEANYKLKEELLDQVERYEFTGDRSTDTKALSEMMKAFRQVGFVPRDKMGIDDSFKKALDLKFSSLKIDKRQRQKIDFSSRLEAMADGGSSKAINQEERNLRNQLETAKSELRQLEGNLTLFSTSKSKNPFLAVAEKSVAEKKAEIEVLTDRLKQTLSVKNEMPKE